MIERPVRGAVSRTAAAVMRVVVAATAASLVGACAPAGPPAVTRITPAQSWTNELAASRRTANNGRFDAADSMLAAYATHHPGTVEALETDYWRAMLKMDPANPQPSLISAMSLLDGYLADVRPHEHAAEAATLRRLAAQLDALNKSMTSAAPQLRTASADPNAANRQPATSPTSPTAPADQSANEAEIKRLNAELAKANAELERIRKRLGTPPPPPAKP